MRSSHDRPATSILSAASCPPAASLATGRRRRTHRPAIDATEMDVMNDEALNRWWRSLSPAARQQLMRDPYASIPAELAQQVVRCSLVLLRTYWPETYPPGPSFRL